MANTPDPTPADEAVVYVHVGLPKTGTTAIQRYMYHNRAVYATQGIHWAETYPHGPHEINNWAHHIYSHKWGGWLNANNFPVTPDQAWQAFGDHVRAVGGRHIVSSERFADLLPFPMAADMLAFIQQTIAPAKLRLIGYVRRQDNLVESHIKELVKGNNFPASLEDYFDNLPSFISFEKSFLKAAEVLGKDDVIVRIYDRKLLVDNDVLADFLQACDLPKLGVDQDHADLANPSINTLTCKVLSDPRVMQAFEDAPYRRAFMRDFLGQPQFDAFKGFSILNTDMRQKLMDEVADDNAKLAEMFLDGDSAQALQFDPDVQHVSIGNTDKIFSYEDMLAFVLGLRPPKKEG